MPERKAFLIRIDPKLHAALERWAADDLRSVNAEIEFLLSRSVKEAGRSVKEAGRAVKDSGRGGKSTGRAP